VAALSIQNTEKRSMLHLNLDFYWTPGMYTAAVAFA